MAFVRGEEGSVSFEKDGGTVAAVAGTRSWSLNITKETLDTTKQGDTFRSFIGSQVSGSGTVELLYDNAASGAVADLMDEVLVGTDQADAKFELFADTTNNKSFVFNGIITSMDATATSGDLQVITCNFVTSSTITSGI
jgi:predicted secreted protein|tara:strand:- start:58 stop:474 length:417 start_codon:yes stop_codon:yes gene_type:complete